jgi:AcrR family transcriptional regulator
MTVIVRSLTPTQTATRQKLLTAAADLAADEGYDGVTMRKVAARAGLSAPTAYQYFSSKDHLLVDVLVELVGQTTAAIDTDPQRAAGTAADRAAATLRRSIQRVAVAPDLYVALTRAYLSGSPSVAHAREAMEASTRRWIDVALDGTDVDPEVVEVLESVLFAHMVGLVTGRWAPDEVGPAVERAVRVVLR